jgi:hypothetical protein
MGLPFPSVSGAISGISVMVWNGLYLDKRSDRFLRIDLSLLDSVPTWKNLLKKPLQGV